MAVQEAEDCKLAADRAERQLEAARERHAAQLTSLTADYQGQVDVLTTQVCPVAPLSEAPPSHPVHVRHSYRAAHAGRAACGRQARAAGGLHTRGDAVGASCCA